MPALIVIFNYPKVNSLIIPLGNSDKCTHYIVKLTNNEFVISIPEKDLSHRVTNEILVLYKSKDAQCSLM